MSESLFLHQHNRCMQLFFHTRTYLYYIVVKKKKDVNTDDDLKVFLDKEVTCID